MSSEKRVSLRFNTAGLSATQQNLVSLLMTEGRIAEELIALEQEEQAEFTKMLNEAIEEVDREHTRLMGLMGQVIRLPAKQLQWENNHLKISKAITQSLSQTGRIPNQTQIAAITGLSRKAVQDHLAQGDDNSVYVEHMRQYFLMAPRVMDSVLSAAVLKSDMKAARMYFTLLEKMQGTTPLSIFNTQNNYIQINKTVVKQNVIGLLAPEQLRKIEELLAEWLPLDPNESIFGPNVPPVGFSKP